jgi:hypothetical protein
MYSINQSVKIRWALCTLYTQLLQSLMQLLVHQFLH